MTAPADPIAERLSGIFGRPVSLVSTALTDGKEMYGVDVGTEEKAAIIATRINNFLQKILGTKEAIVKRAGIYVLLDKRQIEASPDLVMDAIKRNKKFIGFSILQGWQQTHLNAFPDEQAPPNPSRADKGEIVWKVKKSPPSEPRR